MLGAGVTPKVGEGIGLDLWGNSPIRHALLAAPGTSAQNAASGGAVGGGGGSAGVRPLRFSPASAVGVGQFREKEAKVCSC